ncbi:MAG: hypothetical protein IPM16_21715 [Chloroflexi bacterium]|nr:hypothetical protein [Chloroflexota bacterium]
MNDYNSDDLYAPLEGRLRENRPVPDAARADALEDRLAARLARPNFNGRKHKTMTAVTLPTPANAPTASPLYRLAGWAAIAALIAGIVFVFAMQPPGGGEPNGPLVVGAPGEDQDPRQQRPSDTPPPTRPPTDVPVITATPFPATVPPVDPAFTTIPEQGSALATVHPSTLVLPTVVPYVTATPIPDDPSRPTVAVSRRLLIRLNADTPLLRETGTTVGLYLAVADPGRAGGDDMIYDRGPAAELVYLNRAVAVRMDEGMVVFAPYDRATAVILEWASASNVAIIYAAEE